MAAMTSACSASNRYPFTSRKTAPVTNAMRLLPYKAMVLAESGGVGGGQIKQVRLSVSEQVLYISAAIIKKQAPIVVTKDKASADYILSSVVTTKEESTGSKIARCAFAYCAGIGGTQTATVQLTKLAGSEVVWAYNVKKGGSQNFQSSSEAIAKHLKEFLEKKK